MRALDRKLVRDLLRLKWQIAAIALLIACGVSVSVMAYSALEALQAAQRDYYAQTRFGDVFAQAKRAPVSVVRSLERIDGVAVVDARATQIGLMDVPGLVRPALARVIALPDDDRTALNRVVLKHGRMPGPGRADEAVALKTFMDAAGVELGDTLSPVIGGRAFTVRIVGAVLSPEYVYVPAPESFMPDDAHQGVLWAPRSVVERAAGMGGAFNAVSFSLSAEASEPAVMAAVDRILEPYGGTPAVARKDQVSNSFLEAEFRELETSATILPPIFLLVAAALVHMVVSRMVDAEREQIGLLKAFGYRNLEAAGLYLRFAAVVGLIGATAGGLLGAWMAAAITDLYAEYMRFPVLETRFHWGAFIVSTAASVGAAAAGSIMAVRRAVRLSPAVAMRPPRPTRYRKGFLDRFAPPEHVDQPTRMILRNVERFPVRATFTALGLASSLTLLVGTQFLFGSLEHIIDLAYYRVQRWSETVGFAEPRSVAAVVEANRLPGVFAAEPVRVAPALIRANGVEERSAVYGLEPDALMSRPLSPSGRPVPLVGSGVVLSEALAVKLGVEPGGTVDVEVTEGRRPRAALRVAALVEDYSGFVAYMPRRELNRVLGEGDLASGAQLLVAPDRRPEFYRAVERTPLIVGASSRDDTVANWRLVMTEAFRVSITFYVGFAAAIAFGVAYNTSRIALAERARDLATLRVLGFERRECAYILLGELALLGLVALPLGLFGGWAMANGIVAAYSRDDLRLPAMITAQSVGVSISAYLGAMLLAAASVGRRVWELDLVAVLKTRE